MSDPNNSGQNKRQDEVEYAEETVEVEERVAPNPGKETCVTTWGGVTEGVRGRGGA